MHLEVERPSISKTTLLKITSLTSNLQFVSVALSNALGRVSAHELLLGVLHSAAVALVVYFTPVLLEHLVPVHHLGLQLGCDVVGTEGNMPILQLHSLRFGDNDLLLLVAGPLLERLSPGLGGGRGVGTSSPHYWSLTPPHMGSHY